ncbi:MAG: hypothetical protein SFT94_06615 [Pseudanabaenaceae cyanobacterium bins.68]|nr:hypothetical protein [Pseudanabaenaceae cyanobacterium bins.68]
MEFDQDHELEQCLEQLRQIASQHQQDPKRLLHILRSLEQVHRDICDQTFLPALPNTRHELFSLLLEIEAHGGWPYIYRVKLQELCQNLESEIFA